MNPKQHTKAVDLEHKLKVAADQAKADAHNGVIILALRVLEQQGVLRSPNLDGTHGATHEVDADGETLPNLTTVEAAAIGAQRDRAYPAAVEFLETLDHAVKILDELRHHARRLTLGLDTGTYTRRCTDGYSAACRSRDMVDPKGYGGQCDACRKARERDRERAADQYRNLSA